MVNMSIVHGPRDLQNSADDCLFKFPYKPLDSSKSEIRVINLKPGVAPSPVECNLQHVPMAHKSRVSYRALSYTWGAPEPTKILSLMAFKSRSARTFGKLYTTFVDLTRIFGFGLMRCVSTKKMYLRGMSKCPEWELYTIKLRRF